MLVKIKAATMFPKRGLINAGVTLEVTEEEGFALIKNGLAEKIGRKFETTVSRRKKETTESVVRRVK